MQHGGVSIVYDGDGNRVSKTSGGLTTKYLVDTNNLTGYAQVVDELTNSTADPTTFAVARTYTYGLDLISQTQPIAGVPATSYYGYDGHGSVRQLTDSSGTVTDTYTYDAFGNLLERTGTTPNLYMYAGEQFDPELGLYYNRARYLDVKQGRFWGMDVFEGHSSEPATLHKYLYGSANPANVSDPSGHLGLADLGISFSVNSILAGATFGALASGLDRYLQGSRDPADILEQAGYGAAIGAVAAPFIGVKYLGLAIKTAFLGLAFFGAVDATLENNYKLAGFRALLFVGGAVAALKPSNNTVATLIKLANRAVEIEGPGQGGAYGTRVHTWFAGLVQSVFGSEFSTEVSYLNGREVPYGTKGAVRVDVVQGPRDAPQAIYDLKTGSAELTLERIQQIQQHVPGGSSVPVIEIKPEGTGN